MHALFRLQGNIYLSIVSNTFYICFELLPFLVLVINLISINQSCVLIIYRYFYPQVSKGVNLHIYFLPLSKHSRPNCFFQILKTIFHFSTIFIYLLLTNRPLSCGWC